MNATMAVNRRWKLACCALLLAVGCALSAQPCFAAQGSDAPATQVWLVNTRCAPTCGPLQPDAPGIGYWLGADDCQWQPSDRAALLASSHPDVPTIVFLHGNWVSNQDAVDEGWQILGQLREQAGEHPFRLIIWSWPSERVERRLLPDVRLKAGWSDTQAYYLAGLLSELPPQAPVTLIGFSFGARTIGGALELLAGGAVAGLALPEAPAARPQIRAMLLGAAMDNDWLLPGRRNGAALSQVEQMLVTCNPADAVLKRYHWLYCGGYAEALGFTGPACPGMLGPEQAKLEVVSVRCSVGREHDFSRYAWARAVASRLGWYCYLLESSPVAAPVAAP